jgi:hypothetical protein
MSKLLKSSRRASAEISELRTRYSNAKRKHHREVYRILEGAQHIITRLTKNDALATKVFTELHKVQPNLARSDQSLSHKVLMAIMGPNSRKQAWKRARVLGYLKKKGVADAKIAGALETRGGIEKIMRQAAARDGIPSNRWKKKRVVELTPSITNGTNDQDIIVPIRMKLSDQAAITSSAVGSKVTLVARRVGQRPADLSVLGVKVDS